LRDDRFSVRLTLTASIVLAVTPAAAETLTDRARRLFDEGIALEDKHDPRACERFAESYQLVAAAGTGFNLAECMERDGKLLRAWELYSAAALEWARDAKEKRAAIARERATALEARLVTVVIEVADPAVPDMTVTLGDRALAPAALIREHADPGSIEVRAVAPGRVPFVHREDAKPGATTTIRIDLAPIALERPTTIESHRRRSWVIAAVATSAIGTGSLLAGGVLYLQARRLARESDRDSAIARADLATAAGIAGGTLVIAAVVVFVAAPRDVTITPTASAQSVGLTFSRRF
jgi:hypothetical protein